ncbi:MAG: PhzF family phenazine biosynthesis protein [Firmicutes bacterium]|nr:PhzF family phenazine biosynthesis protein [Bacillota bacterium]
MKFYIADAFTTEIFGGNPAGIVLLDGKNGTWPSEETMIKTAAELRYSETAFCMPLSDGSFRTRYFTPAAEVDLCGHATIATFTVLKREGLLKGSGSFINHTLAGDLEIRVNDDAVLMEMAEPEIKGEITETPALKELYGVMGLEFAPHVDDGVVHPGTTAYPKMVSTGLLDIMLPVSDEAALNSIAPDFPALSKLSERYGVVGVHAFSPASDAERQKGITAHARNFAPLYDIDEEAATGTSNGALTYYLQSVGAIGDEADVLILQGEKMGRPSAIRTHIKGKKIMVGGSAVILAEGEIHI